MIFKLAKVLPELEGITAPKMLEQFLAFCRFDATFRCSNQTAKWIWDDF
jgi:hypothetical protein